MIDDDAHCAIMAWGMGADRRRRSKQKYEASATQKSTSKPYSHVTIQ
jgi:hypothetical protein